MSKTVKITLTIFLIIFVICGVIAGLTLGGSGVYKGTKTAGGTEYEVLIDTMKPDFMLKAHKADGSSAWDVDDGTFEKDGDTYTFTVTEEYPSMEYEGKETFTYVKGGNGTLELSGDAPEWMPDRIEKISSKEYDEILHPEGSLWK